ncbi:hypothetical protein OUZ56_016136 [Daphnia magna]|uniref:Uncharacterized protein n=1 Tax=Daphnia magna TaxID=35525 RepID=A0ABR0APS2_9CRUS|nr:hypothetical protein OUZ56_016136 [Daphnia magna]
MGWSSSLIPCSAFELNNHLWDTCTSEQQERGAVRETGNRDERINRIENRSSNHTLTLKTLQSMFRYTFRQSYTPTRLPGIFQAVPFTAVKEVNTLAESIVNEKRV